MFETLKYRPKQKLGSEIIILQDGLNLTFYSYQKEQKGVDEESDTGYKSVA